MLYLSTSKHENQCFIYIAAIQGFWIFLKKILYMQLNFKKIIYEDVLYSF